MPLCYVVGNKIDVLFRGEQNRAVGVFQSLNSVSCTRFSGEFERNKWVRNGAVNGTRTFILNTTENSERMCKCRGSLFHNDECLTTNCCALTVSLGTGK